MEKILVTFKVLASEKRAMQKNADKLFSGNLSLYLRTAALEPEKIQAFQSLADSKKIVK